MSGEHPIHEAHAHIHGPGCGHQAIEHDGHTDYLHDGHLHRMHGDHVDEHSIEISERNPDVCTPDFLCEAHSPGCSHGPSCGHEAVPHGGHTDYLVNGRLHHPHEGHCDDHGPIRSS